ncbi:hypothetical protein BDV12DRAFT_189320 [Aspergillus spectabilis]
MVEHQEDVTDEKSVKTLQENDKENHLTDFELLKGAQNATEAEHTMGVLEAIKKYPKACFFSSLFSAALIMEGFDKAFITAFFAFPAFQRAFGQLTTEGDYQVPAYLQAGVQGGVSAGQVLGLILNGFLADWFGYRYVMLSCLFLMMCFIFIQFFATSIYMYLGAGVLLGIPWGVFQTITTTYAAEVCPNVLRAYLTSLVSMCWSIGYLLGTGVLNVFLKMEGQWAYRIPFALQWVLPIPLAVGIFLAPESPWWLVRKGRIQEAEKALRQLSSNVPEEERANTLAMIEHTIKMENELNASSSYLDLFKKQDLRRTEITVLTYTIQELCVPLLSYVVYFLQQAGMSTSNSFAFGMGQYSLAIVGVVVAWFLTPRFGRRTLILSGTTFVTATTFLIGFLGIPDTSQNTNFAYGIGSLLLIQYFVFFITCGPVIYTVVTEIPSNYLRTKSVVLARATYNVLVIIYGQLVPRMIQRTTWNWGPKSGFFYGGCMLLGLIWGFFRLPETKGRTFGEIDILFQNKVPARKFTKMKIDLVNQTVSEE